jgi:tetratricopeptide (TPR) repeat protein
MNDVRTVKAAKAFALEGLKQLKSASYEAALEAFEESAGLYAQAGDAGAEAAQRMVIADIQCALNQLDKALSTSFSILSHLAAVDDTAGRAAVLNNIGLLLVRLQRYEEADEAFRDALRLFEACGKPDRAADQLGNLGSVCRDRHEYVRALDYYQQALHRFETLGSPGRIADQYANIAYINVMRGEKSAGLINFEKARELYERAGDADKARRTMENIDLLRG